MKLILTPSDKALFKEELINSNEALRILTYKDGHIEVNVWDAYRFSEDSNLMNNIRTQSWYKKDKSILDKAEIVVLPMRTYLEGTAKPYPLIRTGADERTNHVEYDENVRKEERVPGLCGAIEDVYHAVYDFAREQRGERCELGEIPQIRVILKKECPTRAYRNDSEYIAKKLNEIAQQGRQITAKDVESALYKTTRVLGEFCHRNTDPHIVIYYRQFKADNWCEYIAGIANTLAHEYAHYLEYLCCSRCSTEPFSDSRVSEGMADFFGVLFSLKRGGACDLAAAKNRYDEWEECFGSGWPYAEALRFYTVGGNELSPFSNNYSDYETHGSIEKFVRAFKNCPKPAKAYKIMINA